MPKLLLLDKDNTLIQTKSGKQFVDGPTDQVLMPGVKETLDRYADWTKVIGEMGLKPCTSGRL